MELTFLDETEQQQLKEAQLALEVPYNLDKTEEETTEEWLERLRSETKAESSAQHTVKSLTEQNEQRKLNHEREVAAQERKERSLQRKQKKEADTLYKALSLKWYRWTDANNRGFEQLEDAKERAWRSSFAAVYRYYQHRNEKKAKERENEERINRLSQLDKNRKQFGFMKKKNQDSRNFPQELNIIQERLRLYEQEKQQPNSTQKGETPATQHGQVNSFHQSLQAETNSRPATTPNNLQPLPTVSTPSGSTRPPTSITRPNTVATTNLNAIFPPSPTNDQQQLPVKSKSKKPKTVYGHLPYRVQQAQIKAAGLASAVALPPEVILQEE